MRTIYSYEFYKTEGFEHVNSYDDTVSLGNIDSVSCNSNFSNQ